MKTPPFLLVGCPVIILVACVVYAVTYPTLHRTAFHAALIDAEKPVAASETNAPSADGAGRPDRMQHAVAELGLSDAQEKQIAQIRQTVTDRQERRQQIMNVLTPEQRVKWQQMRDARHNGAASPGTSSPAHTGAGLGNGA